MATNDFKPFATGAGANVTAQAEWASLPALFTGFQSGKASSAQVNKAIRQASFISAALAQYVANKSGQDVLDDGDLAGFIAKLVSGLGKDFQPADATLTNLSGKSVSGLLAYLGLGEAAKRSVGNTPGQIPDMSFFPSFGSENGWTRLPNNVICQWGFANFAGAGSGSDIGVLNYYPVPFPNKCLMMVVSHTGYYPQNAGVLSYIGMNNSQFRGYSSVATVETGAVTGAWIAIGI